MLLPQNTFTLSIFRATILAHTKRTRGSVKTICIDNRLNMYNTLVIPMSGHTGIAGHTQVKPTHPQRLEHSLTSACARVYSENWQN